MRLIFNSIKGRLFFWILLLISAVLIIRGVSIYNEIKRTSHQPVKHAIHSKIQILKGLLFEKDGKIGMEHSEILSGEYSIPRSGHYYKVIVNGKVIDFSPSLVDEGFNLTSEKLESYDDQLKESVYISTGTDGEPVMTVQHDFEIFNMPATIYATQSIKENFAIVKRFKIFFLISIPFYTLIAALVGLWIAKQSLKPLKVFSSKIERITHATLSERIDTEFQTEEVKSLARSFNDMLDRLQKAFDSEKRLFADASHELKTPLSVIKTQCEVLLQKDRTKEEYTKALGIIKTTSDTIKRIIDDMLSLARFDSGMLSTPGFKPVSLSVCLGNAIRLADTIVQKKSLKIKTTLPDDINIHGDENSLTEAFLNILDNAIRYNSAGGAVEISASKNKNRAEVTIRDTGYGIKETDLERIFDRFYRADTSRDTEGTGLGLSIAKAIIEAHGGEIRVKSEVNKGSCFTITLSV